MRKKLKDSGGMTFVEVLCAVVILVLLCLLTNTGVHMALNSYVKLTAESETQLLVNSLVDAISDKLRYAVVTDTGAGPTSIFITKDTPITAGTVVTVEADGATGRVTVDDVELLPDGAYGNDGTWGADMRYTVEEAKVTVAVPSGSKPVFTVELKVRGTPDATREIDAKITSFTVQCLNPLKTEP